MISLHLAVSSPKKYKARGVFGSLASLLLALSAFAQGDSSLWGKVTDQTDASVSGATIVIKNLETDTERRLITDDAGLFNAAALPVGQYEITAAKTGFQTDRRGAIRLTVAEREEVDLKLQVGDVHQTIEVPAFSTAAPNFDRGFFRPGWRARSEGPAAKRTKLRSIANAESRHRQLHIAAVRRDRHLKFRGRKYVCRLRAQATGESFSAEWSGIHKRFRDQQHAGRRKRPIAGR